MVLPDVTAVQPRTPATVGGLDGNRRLHRRDKAPPRLPAPRVGLDDHGGLGAPQAVGQAARRHATCSGLDGEHCLAGGRKVLACQVAAYVALDGGGSTKLHLHLALVQLSHLARPQEHL